MTEDSRTLEQRIAAAAKEWWASRAAELRAERDALLERAEVAEYDIARADERLEHERAYLLGANVAANDAADELRAERDAALERAETAEAKVVERDASLRQWCSRAAELRAERDREREMASEAMLDATEAVAQADDLRAERDAALGRAETAEDSCAEAQMRADALKKQRDAALKRAEHAEGRQADLAQFVGELQDRAYESDERARDAEKALLRCIEISGPPLGGVGIPFPLLPDWATKQVRELSAERDAALERAEKLDGDLDFLADRAIPKLEAERDVTQAALDEGVKEFEALVAERDAALAQLEHLKGVADVFAANEKRLASDHNAAQAEAEQWKATAEALSDPLSRETLLDKGSAGDYVEVQRPTSSALHPHEPHIPPALDSEGRCLVCVLICDRDAAQAAAREISLAAASVVLAYERDEDTFAAQNSLRLALAAHPGYLDEAS